MPLFDANCCLGSWPEGGPTLAERGDLLAAMDRLGIAKALVRHTLGIHDAPERANRVLLEQLAGHERLAPCWTGLPPATGELGALDDWLASASRHRVRAVALYPTSHGYPLAPWLCDGLLAPLAERHTLLLIELAQTTYEDLHRLCGDYGGLRVLALSPGYRVLRPLYGLLDQHSNLYVDVSNLANFCGLEALAARFGAERLVFGTGQPRTDGAGIATALRYAALSAAEVAAIAGGNLNRLLGEVQP
ncbi:MAG: amidohydrolase family protein [Chloroflexota bacterium]